MLTPLCTALRRTPLVLALLFMIASCTMGHSQAVNDTLQAVACQGFSASAAGDCAATLKPQHVRFDGLLSPEGHHAIVSVAITTPSGDSLNDTVPWTVSLIKPSTNTSDPLVSIEAVFQSTVAVGSNLNTAVLAVISEFMLRPYNTAPSIVLTADVTSASDLPWDIAAFTITLTFATCSVGEAAYYNAATDSLACDTVQVKEFLPFSNSLNGTGNFVNSTTCKLDYADRYDDPYLVVDSECSATTVSQTTLPSDLSVAFWVKFPAFLPGFWSRLLRVELGSQSIQVEVSQGYIPKLVLVDSQGLSAGWIMAAAGWYLDFDTATVDHWNHFHFTFGARGMHMYFNGISIASSATPVDVGSFPVNSQLIISCADRLCKGVGYDNLVIASGQLTPRQFVSLEPIHSCVGYSCATDFQNGVVLPATTTGPSATTSTSTNPTSSTTSCSADITSTNTWPYAPVGAVYTQACSEGSGNTVYRICCTLATVGQSRGQSGRCTGAKFGTWLVPDSRECIAEVKASLTKISDELEASAGSDKGNSASNSVDVETTSNTVADALGVASARLRETAGIDDTDTNATSTVTLTAAERREQQQVVLQGMRTVALLAGTAKNSNRTVSPETLDRVFDSINTLAFTSGAEALSINTTDVTSQLEGTGVEVNPASPFAFTGALLGVMRDFSQVARRDGVAFNSSTPDAGVEVVLSPVVPLQPFRFSSARGTGRSFRTVVPPAFSGHDNDTVITVLYFDPDRSSQSLPASHRRVSSAVVDVSVERNVDDDAITTTSTSTPAPGTQARKPTFSMAFELSVPAGSAVPDVLASYLSSDFVFPATFEESVQVTGVAPAANDNGTLVLRASLTNGNDQGNGSSSTASDLDAVDDALASMHSSLGRKCKDNTVGKLCYEADTTAIHVPFAPSCSWWDPSTEAWAGEGCTATSIDILAPSSSSSSTSSSFADASKGFTAVPSPATGEERPTIEVTCTCDHMTSFAIIITNSDSATTGGSLSEEQEALTYITYVGTCLSVLCLFLTIVAYAILWKKDYVQQHHRLVVHMCVPLLLSQLFLQLVLQPQTRSDHNACVAVSALLHFFLLSVSGWMLCIAYDIYATFVSVFSNNNDTRTWKLALFVYGACIAIVALCLGVDTKNYTTANYCWIDMQSHLRYAFLVPFAGALLINTVVLTRVLINIKQRTQLKTMAIAGLAFMWILGFSWTFGIIGLFHDHIALQYLFTLFTLGEGVFIFVHYCLRHTHVREAYLLSNDTKLARRQITMLNAKVKDYSSNNKTGSKTGTTHLTTNDTSTVNSTWDVAGDQPMASTQGATISARGSAFHFKLPRTGSKHNGGTKVVAFQGESTTDHSVRVVMDQDNRYASHANGDYLANNSLPSTPPSPSPSRQRGKKRRHRNRIAGSNDVVVNIPSGQSSLRDTHTPLTPNSDGGMASERLTPISHDEPDNVEEIDVSAPGTPTHVDPQRLKLHRTLSF